MGYLNKQYSWAVYLHFALWPVLWDGDLHTLLRALPLSSRRMLRCVRRVQKWLAVNGGVLAVAAIVNAVDQHSRALAQSFGGAASAAAAAAAADRALLIGAVCSTAALYTLVFAACALNLRGRSRALPPRAQRPIRPLSLVWHPIGSVLERYLHGKYMCRAGGAAAGLGGAAAGLGGAAAGLGTAAATLFPSLVPPSPPSLSLFVRWCGGGTGAAAAASAIPGGALLTAAGGFGWFLSLVSWWVPLACRLFLFELTFDMFFYVSHRIVHGNPR